MQKIKMPELPEGQYYTPKQTPEKIVSRNRKIVEMLTLVSNHTTSFIGDLCNPEHRLTMRERKQLALHLHNASHAMSLALGNLCVDCDIADGVAVELPEGVALDDIEEN